MANPKGFLQYQRQETKKDPVKERVQHFREFEHVLPEEELNNQAARCLSCGIPFCHWACPLGNIIPEFNDMLYRKHNAQALRILLETNPFPEFTGRVCPAPCEGSCIHANHDKSVAIKQIERFLGDWGIANERLEPTPPAFRTGRRVAVFGSGPAGLAAATRLNQSGHTVTVYEKEDRVGGLLRYGIPDYKLEKTHIDYQQKKLQAEGVHFVTSAKLSQVGHVEYLKSQYHAVVLAIGAGNAREIPVSGRDLSGIYLAMDFLSQNNRRIAGDIIDPTVEISAKGKKVVIIGGGDTGADCAGTSIRQGATSVKQIELLPKPPVERAEDNPWPQWPKILRTASSHEEGTDRDWAIRTVSFYGRKKEVQNLNCVRVKWTTTSDGRQQMADIPGSEFSIEADLVFIAAGFTGPAGGFVQQLGLEVNGAGYPVLNANRQSSVPWIFAAGDVKVGPSLVVTAIAEGLQVADQVDSYLSALQ